MRTLACAIKLIVSVVFVVAAFAIVNYILIVFQGGSDQTAKSYAFYGTLLIIFSYCVRYVFVNILGGCGENRKGSINVTYDNSAPHGTNTVNNASVRVDVDSRSSD